MKKQLESTGTTNLYRDKPTGVYYLRAKINDRPTWLSLRTDLKATALERLPKELARLRDQAAQGFKPTADCTFGQCIDQWFAQKEEQHSIGKFDKTSLDSLKECRKKIYEFWGNSIRDIQVRKFDSAELARVHNKLHRAACATYVNKVKQILVGVFQIAVDAKMLIENPALKLAYKSNKIPQKPIPSDDELSALLNHISNPRTRISKKVGIRSLIEFVCFFGCRINESRFVLKSDVNLDEVNGGKNPTVHFRQTKNDEARHVPICPEAMPLIKTMLADQSTGEKLLKINECLGALASVCKNLGLPKYTHHTFRHVFATRALINTEGDFHTVAYWLGHRDGGKLLLEKYAHLNHKHSQVQIQKLSYGFSKVATPEVAKAAAAPATITVGGVVYTAEEIRKMVAQQAPSNIIPMSKAA